MAKKNLWLLEDDKSMFYELKAKIQLMNNDKLITDQEALHIMLSIAKKAIRKGVK